MKKKAISMICLMLFISVGFDLSVYGKDENQNSKEIVEITPFWQNIAMIVVDLFIDNNGRAVMEGFVVGNMSTTSITVNASLDRVNANGTLTNIASFNNLVGQGNMWAWDAVRMVARGHYYRLTLTVTAVRHGISETVVFSSRDTRAN